MSDNGYADRNAFMKLTERRYAATTMPPVGEVRVRSLTERERSEYEAAALDSKQRITTAGLVEMRARLIVLCVVDAAGEPLFTHSDLPTVCRWDSGATNQLFEFCRRHCRITESDIEDLAKNFEATTAGDSPTS